MMQGGNGRIEGFSKSERYIAFLLAELPKLKTVTLQAGSHTPPKAKKRDVLATALELLRERGSGVGLEFGVFNGDSMRMAGRMLPDFHFYGFDSFEGFPEDDRPDWQMDFSVGQLPEVPENCSLIKGWFNETLPTFLERNEGIKADFVNIDCDIYSSTAEVFHNLHKHGTIGEGTIIYLDELLNYRTWIWNEMLALFEFLEESGFGIDWIATCQNVFLVDDTLLLLEAGKYPHWVQLRKKGFRLSACLALNDRGIDYGPLHLPHYKRKVQELALLYDKLTKKFETGEIKLEKPYTVTQIIKKKMKSLVRG